MAFFRSDETPTDEPFKQHLTPLEVASAVQSALSALWFIAPAAERSPAALEQAAFRAFATVEAWWLGLPDRTGSAIVGAMKEAFGPPASELEAARAGTLKLEAMMRWVPSESLAQALFWAWLLQPEPQRTPAGAAQVVREILDRQVRNAAEDVSRFAERR